MIKLRRTAQVVSLLFFILLLTFTKFPMDRPPALVNIYMRMSPLHLFATLLNTWHFISAFIPAIVVLALTLVFGRFFCGWICPMGVTLDATDRALRPKSKKVSDAKEPFAFKPVKYGVLAAVLFASYFEANMAGWLDPQSLITRTYTLVILPGFQFATDLFLRGLRPLPVIGHSADTVRSFLQTTLYALKQPAFHGMLATGLIFLAVALLVFYSRRFWCRFLCPMGAILALTSRFSIFRRVVDEGKCTGCGKCVRNCRMGAIDKGGRRDYRGECIECFTCKDVCPEGAVSFRPARRGAEVLPVNFTRRTLVASMGAGAMALPVVRLAVAAPGKSPIRPPGAGGDKGLDFFMQTCLRCGQCMRVCPTNALQPTWFESGFEGLWSPEMIPTTGYCEFNCNLCGLICPSGAIQPLTYILKQRRQIGLAVFNRNRCIPWSRGEECLCCEEHCPVATKAIRFRHETMMGDDDKPVDVKLPYVVEEECIGCGICENKCPVNGARGIYVTGFMPQTSKPEAAGETAAAAGPESLLPDALAGWPAAYEADAFGQENLFEFINGGAEIYYEYGYAAAATRDYERGDDSITVDVFQMANSDAAYGILTYERPDGAEAVDIGIISFSATGSMAFARSDFYVKINYYGSGDGKTEMKAVAEKVSALINRDAEMPGILSFLPDGADASSAVIIAGPLTARAFHPALAEGDPAGLTAGTRGVLLSLAEEAKQLILITTGEESANSLREKIIEIIPDAQVSETQVSGADAVISVTVQ